VKILFAIKSMNGGAERVLAKAQSSGRDVKAISGG